MSFGFSNGSQKRSFKNDAEPFHALENDKKENFVFIFGNFKCLFWVFESFVMLSWKLKQRGKIKLCMYT